MKFFTIYNKFTNQIISSGHCLDQDFENQIVPDNCLIIEGESNLQTHYIKNGEIEQIPINNNPNMVFDTISGNWKEDQNLTIQNIKNKRYKLLINSDWTQLPNNPLTLEKQQAWAVYRQQLRDIPQQSGYPTNVIWPTQPE
jgi:hypothetical protein